MRSAYDPRYHKGGMYHTNQMSARLVRSKALCIGAPPTHTHSACRPLSGASACLVVPPNGENSNGLLDNGGCLVQSKDVSNAAIYSTLPLRKCWCQTAIYSSSTMAVVEEVRFARGFSSGCPSRRDRVSPLVCLSVCFFYSLWEKKEKNNDFVFRVHIHIITHTHAHMHAQQTHKHTHQNCTLEFTNKINKRILHATHT